MAVAKASAIGGAALGVIVVLSACSTASPSAAPPTNRTRSGATMAPRVPGPSANAAGAFTVAGDHPVQPNGSQDTTAATPGARCSRGTLAADRALGARISAGFTLAGFSTSAQLLRHFLSGKGTEVSYPAGSAVSEKAKASSGFKTVNAEVQGVILARLKAGQMHVYLPAAQLPLVSFGSTTSDLYWGFRSTQGLTVTGNVSRKNGRFAGTLTYVIRDSYGFPANDNLGGFGAPMRYLQTICGAPEHASGARWFPDTITVTVPLDEPA